MTTPDQPDPVAPTVTPVPDYAPPAPAPELSTPPGQAEVSVPNDNDLREQLMRQWPLGNWETR